VDGGARKRAYTYVDDGIDALMTIIENKDGVADKRIYKHRQPQEQPLVKELADMMLRSPSACRSTPTAPRR